MSEDLGRIVSIGGIRVDFPKKFKLKDVAKMFGNFTGVVILDNGDRFTVPLKARWENKRYKIAKLIPDTSAFRKYKEAYLEEKP